MHFTKHIILSILILVASKNIYAQKPQYHPNNLISVEDQKSDFNYLKNSLYEAHPGIFVYHKKESFDSLYNVTLAKIDKPLNEKDFLLKITPFIDFIGCGHTDIYNSTAYSKFYKKLPRKLIPIETILLQNKIYLLSNFSSDTTMLIGSEILQIDSNKESNLIKDLTSIVTTDGYSKAFKTNVMNRNFRPYYRYIYGEKDTFRIQLKDSLNRISNHTFLTPKPKIKKPTPTKVDKPKAPKQRKIENSCKLSFPYKTDSIAYFDINKFGGRGAQRYYRKTFKTLKKKKTQNLIIDLRNNGGGKINLSKYLLQNLCDSSITFYAERYNGELSFKNNLSKSGRRITSFFFNFMPHEKKGDKIYYKKVYKPIKNNYKGKVIVLINGGSFSASCIVASTLKDQKRATFIGSETGGAAVGSNAVITPYLTLPNSKLRIRYPLYRMKHGGLNSPFGYGIFPDYPIYYSIYDLLKNKDLAMDKALELIRTK